MDPSEKNNIQYPIALDETNKRVFVGNFARETYGTAHVFLGEKVRKRAIWHEEKEILEKNGVNNITHQ